MASIGILSYLRCQCLAYSAPVAERSSPGDNRREVETLGSATMTLQVHHLMSGPIHPPQVCQVNTEYRVQLTCIAVDLSDYAPLLEPLLHDIATQRQRGIASRCNNLVSFPVSPHHCPDVRFRAGAEEELACRRGPR